MTVKKWPIYCASKTPHYGAHPHVRRRCILRKYDRFSCKGGDDGEESTVPRHMKSQCLTNKLTNESSKINGLSLGGYWGRDLCEHVVKHMKKKHCFICLTIFTLTLYM